MEFLVTQIKKIQDCLEENNLKTLPWSSQSPDVNLMEYIRDIMDRTFHKKNKETFSNSDLLRLLHET